MLARFANRRAAGQLLAGHVKTFFETLEADALDGTVILALPRGGVPVAYEIAKLLGRPLDILVVRKLGVPGHEELAMGAVAGGDVVWLNERLIEQIRLTPVQIHRLVDRGKAELHEREGAYGRHHDLHYIADKNVVVVDDGLATGATMHAALMALRGLHPKRLIVASPVGARPACRVMEKTADALICVERPSGFLSVGSWYEDFAPTTDAEVVALLSQSGGAPSKAHTTLE